MRHMQSVIRAPKSCVTIRPMALGIFDAETTSKFSRSGSCCILSHARSPSFTKRALWHAIYHSPRHCARAEWPRKLPGLCESSRLRLGWSVIQEHCLCDESLATAHREEQRHPTKLQSFRSASISFIRARCSAFTASTVSHKTGLFNSTLHRLSHSSKPKRSPFIELICV